MSDKRGAGIFELFEDYFENYVGEEDDVGVLQEQIEQAVDQVFREKEMVLEILLIRVGIDVDAPIQNIIEEMEKKGLRIESNMLEADNEEIFYVVDRIGNVLEQVTLKSVVNYEN